MSVLSKILPPPSFLTMPCIGVDISDTSLKYMAFSPTHKKSNPYKIEQWGDIAIPNGIVQSGQVVDLKKLVAVLQEFKAATQAEFVLVSLPEERAYLFETTVKRNTPLKEIQGLLEFRLEENVPIPSKDVYFDYSILANSSTEKNLHVAVAAYAKETIQQYYDACVEAKLRPASFEVEAQAMARAVVPHDARGATMLVDFGKTRTGIGIVYQGALLYTSTIDIGGEVLSQALRKVMGPDVAEAELTELKNTQGLVRGVDSSRVQETLISTISVIKDEIATRMQYWHLKNDGGNERRITSIQLSGGSSNLKGLPSYLTESLGVPCVRANVWENSLNLDSTVPPIDRRHSYGYATAIGLALQHST
jgi:type IV pilus assembly protein PilM